MQIKWIFIFIICLDLMYGAKIKDISNILGVRENELTGYGLVIGLNGTGDKSNSKFTMQAVSNMLETMNIKVSPNDIKSKNVAAVIVSAKLPPFARAGDKIDISVSSLGDAKSLSGGTLVLTPLSAIDGNVYAIAQGNISNLSDSLTATIPQAGTIERELVYDIYNKPNATLSLKDADFKNAINIQKAINNHFKANIALAKDPRTISLTKPNNIGMVEFLSMVEDIDIEYQKNDKIIIDEQSGTIITGSEIRITPITISHGDMTIKIIDSTNTQNQTQNNLIVANKPTISSLVGALQKIGTSSSNIISILNAIKKSGAINVDIESI
ncbi:flagellar basal body P-ring protein FlgI [Helicobacter sp. MIT 99-5507]|uniref:flagellar basal body P-ring protein FlgI n=1 Tax=Helicobacter sp. MIT 99-5507 TaxID=152489 RepID=UPI000E1EED7C|nr:flagellar basal body P-ring protein FlgI [Helicobacter sp. MIT 99-5507]RDU58318.1 flagellar biosynthesis protein FlgI [Helicobacter sp. MIT 99-5507]